MTSQEISNYLAANCPTLDSTMPVHPTFLYESLGNIILCIILFNLRKKSKYAYETSAVYFVGYGVIRFFVEGLRTDSLYIGGTAMRASQLLSLILMIAGLLYIAFAHYKKILRQPLPERFLIEKDAKKEPKAPDEEGEPLQLEGDVCVEDIIESEEVSEDEAPEEPANKDVTDDGNT